MSNSEDLKMILVLLLTTFIAGACVGSLIQEHVMKAAQIAAAKE